MPHPTLSTAQNGSAQAVVSSRLTQPLHDPLPPNKHGTWSSEVEDDTPLQTPERNAPPGYELPGSGHPRRQTPAASSSRATGHGPALAGVDLPPGFAGRALEENSYLRGSIGTDSAASTGDLPPGFAPPCEPLTLSNQGIQHTDVDQPPGFSQPGTAQLNTPVSAAIAHTRQPGDTPASVKGSANPGREGRTQASTAFSPATSARALQLPAAASSVPQAAELSPGFSASSSPSFHPAEICPTGSLPTRSEGKAPSSRFQTMTAGPPLPGTAEKPPGFDTSGDGVPQMHRQAPRQQAARALQSRRSVPGLSKPQQLLQPTPQGPKQKAVAQGNVPSLSAAVRGNHPPGFPATLYSPDNAVQSASNQWQPSSSQGSLLSTSAAVGDDLPPGFRTQTRSPAPAVQSASGLPTHAPKFVDLTNLFSAPTAAQSSFQPSPASLANDLPSGFPSAPSAAAASVSHPSSRRAQSSAPASAANDLPPGFSTAPSAAAASGSHPGGSRARPSSAAPYQAASGQSGWDTDETEANASPHHPQSQVRHPHASAADDDLPPGFPNAAQQAASAPRPASASRPFSSTRSQRQPSVGAPVERKVSVTKLPTTPISDLSSAISADAPVQPQRSVKVTKLPASPSPGPHSTAFTAPHSSSSSKRKSQATTQAPAAAAAGDLSPDLPPGFSTMQRSSSTPSQPAVAAAMTRATAAQTPGSTAMAEQNTSSSAAAHLPPGFPRPGAAPQGSDGTPPGFPADTTSAHTLKVPGVPKSSKKEAGRRAQVPLPQSGLQRSDARRKAQMPKVRCILQKHLATT